MMGGFGHGWGMNGFGMNGFSGGGFLGGILMIVFWALIIVGIVYLVKNISNKNDNTGRDNNYRQIKNNYQKEDSAVNIARERYAKGEISKEELDKILNDLK